MNRMRACLWSVPIFCLACGEADPVEVGQAEQAASSPGFGVSFADCTEFAGIGFVPAANARALVPASYALAGNSENAISVVRVAQCGAVSVDGKPPMPGTVAHVGVTVEARDASADINNYTLWFATNLGVLHGKLQALGVGSQNDQSLSYVFQPGGPTAGSLAVGVSPAQGPGYQLSGDVIVPSSAPVPFVATWWADTNQGSVKMRTEFPQIEFSGASMTLTTGPGSQLAALIGGTTMSFAILNSYNAFDTAALTVSRL